MRSAIILSACLLVQQPLLAQTDELNYQQLGQQLKNISIDLDNTASDVEAKRRALAQQVEDLNLMLQNQSISIGEAEKQLKALNEINTLERTKADELQEKYQQISENHDKYVFQTRAQKVVPFVYALAAVAASDGDTENRALHGLAGYGVGALIENTGFGISKGITYLVYKFNFR